MKVLNIIKDLANGGRFRILNSKNRATLKAFADGMENQKHRFTGHGRERMDVHFGLSRASFSVLPRVMLNDMPDDWQNQFVDLMNELDATFPNAPDEATEFKVMGVGEKGRMAKVPEQITNYRRPDRKALARWRADPTTRDEFVDAVVRFLPPVPMRDDPKPRALVVEYLIDAKLVFGDPDYDWSNSGAETIAQEMVERELSE